MNRRFFMQSLAGAGFLAQAAAQENRRTRLYRLDTFRYRAGDQATRLTQFLTAQTPLFTKHIKTVGVFNGVLTSRTQTTLVLTGYEGFDDMIECGRAVESDPAFQKAWQEFENGPVPPYETLDRWLLNATDFSPEIVSPAEKPKTPRYFELRVYHSPTYRQLQLLHERFAGPEIKIFHRCGIHPIFYADTAFGAELPNMTYMTPFATLAEREKAWDTFSADPEWAKVRAESVAKGGQIVDYNNITMFRATPYSPIQ